MSWAGWVPQVDGVWILLDANGDLVRRCRLCAMVRGKWEGRREQVFSLEEVKEHSEHVKEDS